MARKFNLKAIVGLTDRASRPMKKLSMVAKSYRRQLGRIGKSLARVARNTLAMTGIGSALFGVGGLVAMGAGLKKIIGVSAEFENMTMVLTGLLGSSEKAKKSMAWVTDFTANTPFQLGEVSAAFVKLQSYGIDPTSGSLLAAGDAAAGMNKSINQSVEALADAMVGQNERLLEFGIKASTVGDKIYYAWSKNGEDMITVAERGNKKMIKAQLEGIWNEQFGGQMKMRMTTWDGMWSNLQDRVTFAVKRIGDAGLFDAFKRNLRSVLDAFETMEQNGSLQRLSEVISDELSLALANVKDVVANLDLPKVIADLSRFAGATATVIEGIAGAISFVAAVPAVYDIAIGNVSEKMQSVFGDTFPLMAEKVAGILGGAASSFFETWKTALEGIRLIFASIREGWSIMADHLGAVWARVMDAIAAKLQPITAAVGGVFGAVSGVANALGIGGDSTPSPAAAAAAGGGRIQGAIKIDITGAPIGTRVEAGRTSGGDVALIPDVGFRRERRNQ